LNGIEIFFKGDKESKRRKFAGLAAKELEEDLNEEIPERTAPSRTEEVPLLEAAAGSASGMERTQPSSGLVTPFREVKSCGVGSPETAEQAHDERTTLGETSPATQATEQGAPFPP